MLDKKIALVLIFVVAILSISAANASENRSNSTEGVVNNESIADSMPIFKESNTVSNESAQTELTKNNSVESKSISLSASKLSTTYGSGKGYKIAIKNRESKKPMKNIRVLIKVFTGKKYKKYSLKTDNKGIVSFNMKSLPKGKHNVVINIKSTSKVKSAVSKAYIKTIARSNVIKLTVNNHVLNVKLEDNSAAKALMNKLKKGDVTIHAEDYGGFEKVGELGFSLPRSDKFITTSAGDIVLYEGDEISIFYNSNSWSYTKLGKVQNIKDLKKILGTGDVTLVLSLK